MASLTFMFRRLATESVVLVACRADGFGECGVVTSAMGRYPASLMAAINVGADGGQVGGLAGRLACGTAGGGVFL